MTAKKFLSRVQIPEGREGKFEIKHTLLPKGSKVTIVSMRNSLFDGRPASYTILDDDYYEQSLHEDGVGEWMTDSLQEVYQCRALAEKMDGNALIGGLGLGVILSELPASVESAAVIEKSPDVASLVWPYVSDMGRDELIISDIYEHVRLIQEGDFQCAFLDIWQPTSESSLIRDILPLRKALNGKIPQDKIFCWGESEMWGQVRFGLNSLLELKRFDGFKDYLSAENLAKTIKADKLREPFLCWYRDNSPSDEEAREWIDNFIANPYPHFLGKKENAKNG